MLRSYHYIAQRCHGPCFHCDLPIMAGDPYIGEVWVNNPYFWVKKQHHGCPVDPEEDRRWRERTESPDISAALFLFITLSFRRRRIPAF
ncbi:MAG: hypothetical protein V1838_00980 [Patescibacteria group bacterium]